MKPASEAFEMGPLVTVLMSAYNSEAFLPSSLDSICKQTYRNLEIIIFDDASKDKTCQIIKDFSERDSRIILIENATNRGLTRNLFEGMQLAKGKYIARMDADDISLPDRIGIQVDYMEKHPEIDILGTSYVPFEGDTIGKEVRQPETHDAIRCELLLQFTLVHPTVMMRRLSFVNSHLNYDTTFRFSQDFDLWERACRVLRAQNINAPLLRLRSDHPLKISTRNRDLQKECSDRVRKRQLDQLSANLSEEEERVFHEFGSHALAFDTQTMQLLDSSLIKIIHANKMTNQYHQKILEKRAAELFRWNCVAAFSTCSEAFLYYFRSETKAYDKPSMMVKLVLIKYKLLAMSRQRIAKGEKRDEV